MWMLLKSSQSPDKIYNMILVGLEHKNATCKEVLNSKHGILVWQVIIP